MFRASSAGRSDGRRTCTGSPCSLVLRIPGGEWNGRGCQVGIRSAQQRVGNRRAKKNAMRRTPRRGCRSEPEVPSTNCACEGATPIRCGELYGPGCTVGNRRARKKCNAPDAWRGCRSAPEAPNKEWATEGATLNVSRGRSALPARAAPTGGALAPGRLAPWSFVSPAENCHAPDAKWASEGANNKEKPPRFPGAVQFSDLKVQARLRTG